MSIVKEFREFAVKGNVVDLAVGVIIGTAFGKIVTSSSATSYVLPLLGLVVSGVDFSHLAVALKEGWTKPPVLLKYGTFFRAFSTS